MNALDAYLRRSLRNYSAHQKPPAGAKERLLDAAARPAPMTKSKMAVFFIPEPQFHGYCHSDWSSGMFEWTNGIFLRADTLSPRPLI
jgi:hypothetical protein